MNSREELGGDEISRLRFLPWVVALVALVGYLLTLNHWVTFGSLAQVVRLSGLSWQADVFNPVYWLVTYPIRWLPVRHVPLALNLFSAVCAALTLCFLARSVILLPHDRTHEQRQREQSPFATLSLRSAWLPPVLAVLICGLELGFWEQATVASSEIFDLMVFAYIVRCLLEYRIGEEQRWLSRAAFLYGASMSNNWVMIGMFPLLIVALIWIKGLTFFNSRFLGKMVLWGFVGLLFYLVLPLVNSRGGVALGFWPSLKANLAAQRGVLGWFFSKNVLWRGERPLWVLALPSLAPLLLLGISWPSYFGDPSKLGVAIATWVFHLTHGFLLLFCIWVALDPALSPRHFAPGMPLLPAYYLGALCIGYFTGYFLLVFGAKPFRRGPPETELARLINSAGKWSIRILCVVAPVLLIQQNLPRIRTTNGEQLWRYASLMNLDLPHGNVVVLADHEPGLRYSRRLTLMQLAALQTGRNKELMFLSTGDLQWPEYHRFIRQNYGERWPSDPPKGARGRLDDSLMLGLVATLAKSNAMYYLHPSFGYYFEAFYAEPHGLIYHLLRFPNADPLPPALAPGIIEENEKFWSGPGAVATRALASDISPPSVTNAPFMDQLRDRLHLIREPDRDGATLGGYYSRALNYWGVQMQKNGHWTEAGACFSRAVDLNPDNSVAEVNLGFNRIHNEGRAYKRDSSKSAVEKWAKYRNWADVMGEYGPYDEPGYCLEQANLYTRAGLYHQAFQHFYRASELDPNDAIPRLAMARFDVLRAMPDAALQIVTEINSDRKRFGIQSTNQAEVVAIEMAALLSKGQIQEAEAAARAAMEFAPKSETMLATIAQIYINHAVWTNAAKVLDQELEIAPGNVNAWLNRGVVSIQLSQFEEALKPLSEALKLEPGNYPARFNRAIANLQAGHLDEGRTDYEVLVKDFPKMSQLYYGLGEIAYRQKDTNAAIRYYQLYLTNSPPGPEEAKAVTERLKELKAGSR